MPILNLYIVFAVQKAKTDGLKSLIIGAYIIYNIFVIIRLVIYEIDIHEISSDFKTDINKIKSDSGLPKKDVTEEEKKVKRRIRQLRILGGLFGLVFIALAIIFTLNFLSLQTERFLQSLDQLF